MFFEDLSMIMNNMPRCSMYEWISLHLPPRTHVLDLGWFRSKKSPWSYEKNTWHGDFRGLPAPPGGLGGLFGGGEESSSSSAGGGLGGGLGGLFDETQTDGKTKGPMKLGKKTGEKITVHLTFCWLWVFFFVEIHYIRFWLTSLIIGDLQVVDFLRC